MTPEQRRQAWAAMSAGREDFPGYAPLASVQHRLEPRPPLWECALDTAAAVVLVTAVGVLGALAGRRSAAWTSEDGEDA